MMYILFSDILQLQFFLTFSRLLFQKDARSEYGGLTIYDDAFKNYLWVNVFDDNVFAIIKSHWFSFVCVLTWSLLGVKKSWATPRSVSFRGLIQNFRQASVPPLYAGSPAPGFCSPKRRENCTYICLIPQQITSK